MADAIKAPAENTPVNGISQAVSVYNTTTTTKNASVTLFALDSLNGLKQRVAVEFYLALDAAATFTPNWYVTRPGDLGTFIARLIPAIATIATPAANGRYRYEYGDLVAGEQLEFRVAQNNLGAVTVACDAILSFEE